MTVNLLEKTEVWIDNVILDNVNLTDLAKAFAKAIEIDFEKVLVVDVRETHITFDVLEKVLDPKQFFGKKDDIFDALAKVKGFSKTDLSDIHSDGILGMINLETRDVAKVIDNMNQMTKSILANIKRRAIVFSTGFEVEKGYIEDTNSPMILNMLEEKGYKTSFGGILKDEKMSLMNGIMDAIDSGYGLVITTGGVGAEDKDYTIEAISTIDPQAYTPYIVHYTKGQGRHVKDGVRIAVGSVGESLIVALPGPNDEVKIGMKALMEGLEKNVDKLTLSNSIAKLLSDKLMSQKTYKSHS